jgi:putative transposase
MAFQKEVGMPWRKTSAMDERCQFVIDAEKDWGHFTELCAYYGISTKTGYKWLGRFKQGGMVSLQNRSRAPKNHPNEVSVGTKEAVLEARRTHPTWGPKKLRRVLQDMNRKRSWPALSTIGEIIKSHGLSIPRKRRRHATPSTQPFGNCDAPNRVWCADYKGWFRTGDGYRCDPLTITDGFSRYLLRCQITEGQSYEVARGIFEATFREYGLPIAIRTDNGAPFASIGLAGLSRLSVWWLRLGIDLERIKPGKPQQNGRHERMHLTLKKETAKPPAQSLRAQQRRFDSFREEYNQMRPHEALAMKTPGSLYQSSPRSYPTRIPEFEYDSELETRVIGARGEFYWKGNRIFVSEVLQGERIGLHCCQDRYWEIYLGTLKLGILDSVHLRLLNPRQIKFFEMTLAKGDEYGTQSH